MTKLCPSLQPILALELQLGNEIARVDEPAGTECPFAIILRLPIHRTEIESSLRLGSDVEFWECTDRHYPQEAGYFSTVSRHSIAGPLASEPLTQYERIDSVNCVYGFARAVIATARADGRIDLATAVDDALHLGSSALEIIGAIKVIALDHWGYLRTRFSKGRLQAVIAFVEHAYGQR